MKAQRAYPMALNKQSIFDFKRQSILKALKQMNYHRQKTADHLGMPLRSLTFLIAKYKEEGYRVTK